MKARAIRKRSLFHLGAWIRFKNRWELWGMDSAPGFACVEDVIAFLEDPQRQSGDPPEQN